MGVAPVFVEIDEDLGPWSVEVPGRVTARAEALAGPTPPAGARVQVHNAGGAEVGPGQIATWGRATTDQADAFGFSWDRSGKSSKHFPFDWSGPDRSTPLYGNGIQIPARRAGRDRTAIQALPYSSWRRSQRASSPSSWRPSGVRSRRP